MDLQGADIAGCQALHVLQRAVPDTGKATGETSDFHGLYHKRLLPLQASGQNQLGWLEERMSDWKIVCSSSVNPEDTSSVSATNYLLYHHIQRGSITVCQINNAFMVYIHIQG